MLATLMALSDAMLAANSAQAASEAFHAAAVPLGATYLQTRSYQRPIAALTPTTHWQAGGFVARFAADGWVDSDEFRFICIDCNPLVAAVRGGRTRYRFSDFAPHAADDYGAYWEAMRRARIADALCATSYGADRRVTSLHLGFATRDLDDPVLRALHLAGLLLTERLMTFDLPAGSTQPLLTPRERDALALVAEGKTDWEIGTIIGVSEATARFHVDNSRRKLDATNRAHAVARYLAIHGAF